MCLPVSCRSAQPGVPSRSVEEVTDDGRDPDEEHRDFRGSPRAANAFDKSLECWFQGLPVVVAVAHGVQVVDGGLAVGRARVRWSSDLILTAEIEGDTIADKESCSLCGEALAGLVVAASCRRGADYGPPCHAQVSVLMASTLLAVAGMWGRRTECRADCKNLLHHRGGGGWLEWGGGLGLLGALRCWRLDRLELIWPRVRFGRGKLG